MITRREFIAATGAGVALGAAHFTPRGATFVPLQRAFDDASARGGPAHWLGDGVHPTPAGHALIAERWRAPTGILLPAS
jgi:lysophospholipase L1-like esterase